MIRYKREMELKNDYTQSVALGCITRGAFYQIKLDRTHIGKLKAERITVSA